MKHAGEETGAAGGEENQHQDPGADETAYLMSSPLNARRLLDSIDRLENGDGTVHDLIED